MTEYIIPSDVDFVLFRELIEMYLRFPENLTYGPPQGKIITFASVHYDPELTSHEQAVLDTIIAKCRGRAEFLNLPNWATWTPAEAQANIQAAILSGYTKAQADSYIDTTAITLAGVRTVLKLVAGAIVDTREILALVGKAIMLLRDLVLRS